MITAPKLTESEENLDKGLKNMILFLGLSVQGQELDFDDPMDPFQLRKFSDPVIMLLCFSGDK